MDSFAVAMIFLADFAVDAACDVVTDRTGEKEGLLLHNPDLGTQKLAGILVEIDAIKQICPPVTS